MKYTPRNGSVVIIHRRSLHSDDPVLNVAHFWIPHGTILGRVYEVSKDISDLCHGDVCVFNEHESVSVKIGEFDCAIIQASKVISFSLHDDETSV